MNSTARFNELLNTLKASWAGLPDKPDETPETTLRAIWQHVCQGQTDELHPPHLTDDQYAKVLELVDLRLNGTPLAYLIGSQEFMGIGFLASPQAMIPRKETEILGKAAVETARSLVEERHIIQAMDICTGSGNIALALAYYVKESRVFGSDVSPEAVALAKRNAEHLHLTERVNFFVGDLFAPFEQDGFHQQMDLITCNPPYISSANVEKMAGEIVRHEPRLAFDGGHFGIQVMTRFLREAPRYLRHGGWICFEVGVGQGQGMMTMVKRTGFYDSLQSFSDEDSNIRVIKARLDGSGQ